jgi:hypothetical protein
MTTKSPADELEILRRASRVIAHFGPEAWARCAAEVCHLLEIDDPHAAHQCWRVLTAIQEIQCADRAIDATVH